MGNSKGFVDFHAHILPRADHGSGSVETSLFQLNAAKSAGVYRVIATPHFYPHRHLMEDFLRRREEAYHALKPHIPEDMEVRIGAEVLICSGIQNIPEIESLFVEGTRTLLLELPFDRYESYFPEAVKELREMNIDVIIAHADRYAPAVVEKMIEAGSRLQLNVSSLDHFFKKKSLFRWIDSGFVVALGSDIHGKDEKAYKHFTRAISKIKNKADYIKQESDKIFDR
jgi:protein-tyrosine phosphatase